MEVVKSRAGYFFHLRQKNSGHTICRMHGQGWEVTNEVFVEDFKYPQGPCCGTCTHLNTHHSKRRGRHERP